MDISCIFSNDRMEEEKVASRAATEKWRSGLDESKKSLIDKGVESILCRGCVLAARQASDNNDGGNKNVDNSNVNNDDKGGSQCAPACRKGIRRFTTESATT